MLTPLPAAFLMICSALPSRSLCSKLRRGRGGEVGACTGACVWIHPSAAGGRGRSDVHRHAAHDYREGTVYRADENVEGVQEAGRKTPLGKGPRKDMRSLYLCSLIDARRNVQGREEVFANVLQRGRADKKANTLWGGGALQACDLRPPEDGGECSGTLASNPVVVETAERGMERMRASVSTRALTRIKCTLCGVLARRT
jgi:hypothetical protein